MRTLTPAAAFVVAAAGIGLFSIMDAFMKSLVLAIGVYNAMLWRTMLSTALGAVAWRVDGARRPSRRGLRLHLMRGIITAAMALLFFWGLGQVPMAQAIALTYVAPILAMLLAAATLGERVGARVAVGSVAALVGVAIIVAGQSSAAPGEAALAGSAAILASAVLYAVNLVIARVQAQAARPGEVSFFQTGIIFACLALAAPWLAQWPAAAEWPKLAAGAALASASLFLLAWAYAHGETGYLAMTEYTSFVYASALGWLVFGEHVAWTTLAGAGVIVAACLYAARRPDIAGQTAQENAA